MASRRSSRSVSPIKTRRSSRTRVATTPLFTRRAAKRALRSQKALDTIPPSTPPATSSPSTTTQPTETIKVPDDGPSNTSPLSSPEVPLRAAVELAKHVHNAPVETDKKDDSNAQGTFVEENITTEPSSNSPLVSQRTRARQVHAMPFDTLMRLQPNVSEGTQNPSPLDIPVPDVRRQYAQQLQKLHPRMNPEQHADQSRSQVLQPPVTTPPQDTQGPQGIARERQRLPRLQTTPMPPPISRAVTNSVSASQANAMMLAHLDLPVPRSRNCDSHRHAHRIASTVGPLLSARERNVGVIMRNMTELARGIIALSYSNTSSVPHCYTDKIQMQVAYFWALMYNKLSFDNMGSELMLQRYFFASFIRRFAQA